MRTAILQSMPRQCSPLMLLLLLLLVASAASGSRNVRDVINGCHGWIPCLLGVFCIDGVWGP